MAGSRRRRPEKSSRSWLHFHGSYRPDGFREILDPHASEHRAEDFRPINPHLRSHVVERWVRHIGRYLTSALLWCQVGSCRCSCRKWHQWIQGDAAPIHFIDHRNFVEFLRTILMISTRWFRLRICAEAPIGYAGRLTLRTQRETPQALRLFLTEESISISFSTLCTRAGNILASRQGPRRAGLR